MDERAEELDARRAEVRLAVSQAGAGWADAMRAHRMAPPDADFALRLRTLAGAARSEQTAWEEADAAGLLWRPIPGAEGAEPPYELRPGTGRRGPAELWERFDAAVVGLNQAISGSSAGAVAAGFAEMAEAASALAQALTRAEGHADGRARGAA